METMALQVDQMDRDAAGTQTTLHIRERSRDIVNVFQHRARKDHVDLVMEARKSARPYQVLNTFRVKRDRTVIGPLKTRRTTGSCLRRKLFKHSVQRVSVARGE